MSADFAHQFGSYVYGSVSGLYVTSRSDSMGAKLRTADTPGQDQIYAADSKLAPRRFALKGVLVKDTADNLRTAWDAFRAAHAPGAAAYFYPHSDRYRVAQCESITDAVFDGRGRHRIDWAVDFFCADPLEYAVSSTSTTGLAAGGTINNAGNRATKPTLTIVVSSTGSSGYINLTNSTTSKLIQLVPGATGTITLNAYAETVTRGGASVISEMNGEFWTLAPGNNTLAVATFNSLTVSSISCAHNAAYV